MKTSNQIKMHLKQYYLHCRNQLESDGLIIVFWVKKQTVLICVTEEYALEYSMILMLTIWFRIKYKSTFYVPIVYIYMYGYVWIWVLNLNIILQYILSEDVIQETRISVEYVKESKRKCFLRSSIYFYVNLSAYWKTCIHVTKK